MSLELTLGAEEELHLIDLETRRLSARAPQILSQLPPESFTAEIQRTTVEMTTEPVATLDGLRRELARLRGTLAKAAASEGLAPASVATAPLSDFADFELTSSGRYGRMQEQYRMLVDEQLICGLQIHVGVSDRDLAVQIMQRVAQDLPVLTALSASSPYWSGNDTGYASIRSIIWQRWPSAGATGTLGSAAEYDALLEDLIRSGVIADSKMAYFDVRPSSHVPTLELRVCDACPIIDDAVLIAGLFRGTVAAAARAIEAGEPWTPLRSPMHRAAMWQAARSGLSDDLLDHSPHPRPVPASQAVLALVERLRPDLEELGDYDEVSELARRVLARGNSADRQRAAFAERGSMEDVVDLVLAETSGPASGPLPASAILRGYRARAGDEAIGLASRPRGVYHDLISHHQSLTADDRAGRELERDRWVSEAGLTFGTGEDAGDFHVDLMPRVISDHEWAAIRAGVTQRARAIEHFLRDVYADQRILTAGIVPRDAVSGTGAWRSEALRLPVGSVHAPVMGFDLVRNEVGGWRVLEDNVRSPSGLAFAVAAREIMDGVMPDAPRPADVIDPTRVFADLRDTLLVAAPEGSRAALLSSGPSSSAWYEHRRLAEEAGLLLLTADDVRVADDVVYAGDERVGALYLRLDDELALLKTATGDPLGEQLLDVAASGGVVLANAPGNGVADDKAMYCYVPEFIGFYLDERPLLEAVPTYRTSDEVERAIVLGRLGELVTKPVDGQGGAGVMIGPYASAAAVAERRTAILESPSAWVAQELVRLSSHPTWADDHLQPRHVDLRVFAFVTGTGPDDVRVADVALTRVAREGSMVVNSSAGGGAKDTWIRRATKEDD